MIDSIMNWVYDTANQPTTVGTVILVAMIAALAVSLLWCVSEDKPLFYIAKGDKYYKFTFKGMQEISDEE